LTKQGTEASGNFFRFHCLNDLEEAVFPVYPELARIKRELFRQGAAAAVMSGSGASLLGLFRAQHVARRAADFFQAEGMRTYCHALTC
jgi:4-diphosphocytidyl-2-C-methyl-D-erythritol kinase